ncbi:MAG: hypothetical protein PHX44_10065 [Sulfurimonas sp.]|uniref:hypothetical protein n=1 Tax=Sulfurimonas sp. TaxID=2022749 RepID=UPI00260E7713|nr:hypothetical protein [Sulfurimonas sp.]MDD2653378.1 hypothetical protein [Sulfurimonas sp.]MDD3450684.1 hypothetical protein [Sulfurimonas sp.]
MSENSNLQVIHELSEAIRELNPDRVAWVFKWQIIDLRQKAQVLLESVSRLEANEKEAAITAAQAFLTEIQPVVQELNNQKIGA